MEEKTIISEKIIETIFSSLKSSKTDLKRQLENLTSERKINIVKSQLEDVEEALEVVKKLLD